MKNSCNYSKFARSYFQIMRVFTTKSEIEAFLSSPEARTVRKGLVPTMGALHEGHLSLVRQACAENDMVIVSIFVNPTQFNNPADLHQYPKSLEKDLELLEGISSSLLIFAPSVTDIYSGDISSRKYDFNGLDKVMEGRFREGHFNGVGTIVETLFKVINPDIAYFGEKDFQQLQIIRKLVADKNLGVVIKGCPIVREPNGLAMSSRNQRLSTKVREEASFIYQTLLAAKSKFGTKSARYVMDWVQRRFKSNPYLKLEYVEITDVETLTPVKKKQSDRKYRAFIAAYADGVRLIDNIALN